jgi:putative membrane protein
MRKWLLVLTVAIPVLAWAKDNPDESFFEKAAQAGMSEVEAGKMAQAKATSPAVKEFAAMMVKDHSAANAKLKAIATAKGVELPAGPSMMQKAKEKKTDMHSGESFDKDYIQGQIKAHEDTVELLQKEIDEGKDAEAKAFATETLPKVKMHLEKINKIAADAGVKS